MISLYQTKQNKLLYQMVFLCLTDQHTFWNMFSPMVVLIIVRYTVLHWTSDEAIGVGICFLVKFLCFSIVKPIGAVRTVDTTILSSSLSLYFQAGVSYPITLQGCNGMEFSSFDCQNTLKFCESKDKST